MDAGLLPRRESDTLDTYYLRSRKVKRYQDEFEQVLEDETEGPGGFHGNGIQEPSTPETSVFVLEDGAETGTPLVTRRPDQQAGLFKLSFCVLLGVMYGFAIDRSRVTRPSALRNQMLFRQWTYAKFIVTGICSVQLCLCIIALIPSTRDRLYLSMRTFGQWLKCHGPLAVASGSFISGVGMVLAGACPLTIFTNVGAWNTNAIYSLIGAVLGAMLYGLLESKIGCMLLRKSPPKKHTVFGTLRVSYPILGLPVCVLLSIALWKHTSNIPWYRELHPDDRNRSFGTFTTYLYLLSWPPMLAGALSGVVQTALMFLVGDVLDASRALLTLGSQCLVSGKLQEQWRYLAQFKHGASNWANVCVCLGMLLGGYLSATLVESVGKMPGVRLPEALLGGLLMAFGARMAGGGTSRHVLSGCAMFFWVSLLAVPCMLSGGYVTTHALYYLKILNIYTM